MRLLIHKICFYFPTEFVGVSGLPEVELLRSNFLECIGSQNNEKNDYITYYLAYLHSQALTVDREQRK